MFNSQGIHQSGHWGYCDPYCDMTEIVSGTTTTAASILTTTAEEASNSFCPCMEF